ncbi:MAG: formate dehydrogenase accessory sulfurtransferase FdhD [Actinomycetota bacterium]|nr:formate dehydrogenase accessory sulfurtransferase FdhD [Actinomycetota bacterium]
MGITSTENITRIEVNEEVSRFDVVDDVIVEYKLKLCVDGHDYGTILCSPEHLDNLVIGRLSSEGIIKTIDDIRSVNIDENQGIASVILNSERKPGLKHKIESGLSVKFEDILGLMKSLDARSTTFKKTGGVHGCALCDNEKIIAFDFDLGRHNAIDKIIGYAILNKVDLAKKIIAATCRISSEIISKIAQNGIPIISSRSAPTALAIKIARESGITLIGFAREKRMNIYSMPERVL